MNTIDLTQARLMIVDDEPANLLLLDRLLKASGYNQITSAHNGMQALELFVSNEFDIVLLDLNMPHMDGFEVLTRLRQQLGEHCPPVLVVTAQGDQRTRLKALELGARDFVSKPFERTELLSRIRNHLEVRMLQRQLLNQNAMLEQRVRERTQAVVDAQNEIVRRLGIAAEYRDNETGKHILRMSQFAAAIGETIGLSADDVNLLLNAAPMHDVGKIGISDSLLLKPGRFTDEERQEMQKHSEIGAKILSGSELPLMVAAREIALTHHERWDGQGYPNGLAGEAIPLFGRIAALTDVFDALTSVRPYKKAWPVDEAIRFVQDNSGTHFDPALVEAFMTCLPRILAIKSQLEDQIEDFSA